jgi:hypothetical protein
MLTPKIRCDEAFPGMGQTPHALLKQGDMSTDDEVEAAGEKREISRA